MTVGSVRGNERFEIPFRVAQGGRSVAFTGSAEVVEPMDVGREAMSVGGQERFVPPLIENVGWPH